MLDSLMVMMNLLACLRRNAEMLVRFEIVRMLTVPLDNDKSPLEISSCKSKNPSRLFLLGSAVQLQLTIRFFHQKDL